MTNAPNAISIVRRALEISSDSERSRYLENACGADAQLRARVDELLAAHAQMYGSEQDVEEHTLELQYPPEQPGNHIGPYKLRERLGAGGMGVVWAAEQTQPIRREVALKLIKPGMDSEEILARFEAERQALSLMNHSNVARVLDAGTTDLGRPYFVMELIRGVPICDYCDAHQLSVRERLELFTEVCQAIQHAHQKGIIHRDIKPSNVLVTEQDERAVPKVIDFGVAKALHQPLTDRPVYTTVSQAIGTLAYMSPEQAALGATDIDTRADIYGLGVLLYELLTGSTPFDRKQLRSTPLEDACRIIREQDPPNPSTKITTLGERADLVSACRRTDPMGLKKAIRGELDWIVMKALERDRSRRYDAAGSLAADVRRHLSGEIVQARPASRLYRLQKFVRSHRVGVVAASAVALTLILATAVSSWQALARKRAQDALEERQSELFESVHELARVYLGSHMYRDAESTLGLLLSYAPDNHAIPPDILLDVRSDLARAIAGQGRLREASDLARDCLADARQTLGIADPLSLTVETSLAKILGELGHFDEAVSHYNNILEQKERIYGTDARDVMDVAGEAARLYAERIWSLLADDDAESLEQTVQLIDECRPVLARTDLQNGYDVIVVRAAELWCNYRRDGEIPVEEDLSGMLDHFSPWGWFLAATAAYLRGDHALARDWYAAAWDLGRRDQSAELFRLSRLVSRECRFPDPDWSTDLTPDEYIEVYERLIELHPSVPWLRNRRGSHHQRLARWDEAREDYAAAAKLDEDETMHWLNLAICAPMCDRQSDYIRACRALHEACADTDEDPLTVVRFFLAYGLDPTPAIPRDEFLGILERFERRPPWFLEYPCARAAMKLALYRADRFTDALNMYFVWNDTFEFWLSFTVDVLALFALGENHKAQLMLEQLKTQYATGHFSLTGPEIPMSSLHLDRAALWCVLQLLLREAEAVAQGGTQGAGPASGAVPER